MYHSPTRVGRKPIFSSILYTLRKTNDVVLLCAPDEHAIYVYKSHTGHTSRFSTWPTSHVALFECYWLCDEWGGIISSDACLLYSAFEDFDLPCMETILKIDYLYNVGRWLIRMHDTCFVLDTQGMRYLLTNRNKLQLIAEIDDARLNCMYASTTSTEVRVTDDHSILVYMYKNRICAARTVYPFHIYPNVKLDIPRGLSDPVLRIRYLESERRLQVFCLRHIYTFSLNVQCGC